MASRNLSDFVELVELRSVQQNVREASDIPAEEILMAAKERSANPVVVGTHGRSGLARFFVGSVAEAVLSRADRDVLVVPFSSVGKPKLTVRR